MAKLSLQTKKNQNDQSATQYLNSLQTSTKNNPNIKYISFQPQYKNSILKTRPKQDIFKSQSNFRVLNLSELNQMKAHSKIGETSEHLLKQAQNKKKHE